MLQLKICISDEFNVAHVFVCFIRQDAFVFVSRLVWPPPQPLLPIVMPRLRPRPNRNPPPPPARNPPPPPPRPAAPAPAPAVQVQAPPPPPPQQPYVRQGAVTSKYCFNLFMLYDRHIYYVGANLRLL